ncbi:Na-Ca exchanger/integrin-beta4 [Rhizobium sp. CCGE 510]|nr:Na-Ca exchanger/integrin-beta4 [Rhizobium sp. CCGE 510]
MTFNVSADGDYSISNLTIIANNDDFDFQSDRFVAQFPNWQLTQALDPYGLIPVIKNDTTGVKILYDGSGKSYASYTQHDFEADAAFVDDATGLVSKAAALSQLAVAEAGLLTGLGYLGSLNSEDLFRYYTADGKKIVYGTNDDDVIDRFPHPSGPNIGPELSADVYTAFQMVGGKGNDHLTGGVFSDELWGGDGNDTLSGGLGNDRMVGGAGDDTLEGGAFVLGSFEGDDSAVYKGGFSSYKIEFLEDDSVRIVDQGGNSEGTDTLTGVEFAEFSDKKVSLKPGQDIAFVIDTTGSMYDDIDAVKAQSTAIIDAIFDVDRGLLNSRIAVVGYNDPYTQTFTSFTDQSDPADRKSAAISAINELYASGGGDYPEAVYSGLLRALNGGAGEWRDNAAARKIILFGDAPPNDDYLASQVFALASDLNVSVSKSLVSASLSSNLYLTSFELADPDTGSVVPVQIFSIIIGGAGDTTDAFNDISGMTGGKSFTASDASEVVSALLEVINLPIYTISSDVASVDEGDSGSRIVQFTVSRDVADDAATLILAAGGTADDSDFTGLPASVSFKVGELSKTLSLAVIGDTAAEPDETITVTIGSISQPATYGSRSIVLTVLNDDTFVPIKPTDKDDDLLGTGNGDVIHALKGNDVVHALGGDDTVDGGIGADIMFGGAGNDTYIVDNKDDKVVEDEVAGTDDGGRDHVVSSVDFDLSPFVEDLRLTGNAVIGTGNSLDNHLVGGQNSNVLHGGAGADSLSGKGGSDTLYGGKGNDLLSGGEGSDWLYGGAGNDRLAGGQGRDYFVFNTALKGSTDRVNDFTVGEDTIVLDSAIFDTLEPGHLSSAEFSYSASATTFAQRVLYDSTSGRLLYDSDGLGDDSPLTIAILKSGVALDEGSIFVI